jgi:epsilon-lactone hydrolase
MGRPATDVTRLVARLRELAPKPGDTIERMRRDHDALLTRLPQPSDVAFVSETGLARPAEWIVPRGVPFEPGSGRVLLYLHGGAYAFGSMSSARRFGALLAQAADAPTLSLDYRLAPEHPFPAGVSDALESVSWLMNRGHRADQIFIAGESAGGGLTLATMIALRNRDLPMPAGGICISPWVDLSLPPGSIDENTSTDPQIARWLLERTATHYLAGASATDALASPVHADLRGLPPLLIHVGNAEGLRDDSYRLADRASAAGVDVTLQSWDGMFHVWHVFAPRLTEAAEALAEIDRWVTQHG